MGKFTPNHRKLGGRAKGTPNRSTLAGREFAERLVNDPEYLASVEARAKAGKLQPGIEQMIWHYAIGKPRESLELSGNIGARDVATMSTDELLAELEQHHAATAAFLASHHHQRPPQSQGD